jgi:N-acetylmuramoyl-L-alanine amidase
MLRVLVLVVSFLIAGVAIADDADVPAPVNGVPAASDGDIATVLSSPLMREFVQPTGPLGFTDDDLAIAAKSARIAYGNLLTTEGDPSASYDVVIQPGHFGRTKGATGGTGALVTEQQIAALVAALLSDQLTAKGVSVAIVPADGYARPLQTKIFLALHTDASALQCSAGASVGYNGEGNAQGMHGIAAALAITLGIDPDTFLRDSYTKDEHYYYAFKDMVTSDFGGLIEMSELTCPKQETNLLGNAATLATNLSYAIRFALKPAAP